MSSDTEGALGAPKNPKVRLTPRFWQSPFSLAAGTMITSQVMIYGMAWIDGRVLPFDLLWPLTAATVLILTAGLWPAWNYVEISEKELEQHAGLTHVRVPWADIKSVRTGLHGVDIHFVRKGPRGQRSLSRARVFNRYGIPASRLHHLIDEAWQQSSAKQFA